ncbi:MAG: hypothetical protein SGARI_001511 [Bacillariaceae sp.]
MDGMPLDMDDFDGVGVGGMDDDVTKSNNASVAAMEEANNSMIGEDFDSAMKFLMGQDSLSFLTGANPQPLSDFRDWSTASNPFLAAIAVYLEERNLPFQYVDCWVPSLAPKSTAANGSSASDDSDDTCNNSNNGKDVCLLPAGFVTRDDQDTDLTSALVAFGEYSKSFSFKPGKGLPGRVYISGESAWQLCLNETSPAVFARAGGAKVYGLKTACAHIPQDECLTKLCSKELAQFEPTPRWRLVIEIGSGQDNNLEQNGNAAAALTNGTTTTTIEELDDDCINPNIKVDTPPFSSVNVTASSSSNQQATGLHSVGTSDENLLRRLISLLGDQMPSMHSSLSRSSGESSSALHSDMQELLPDLMRMRLLLLRPISRRSDDENDVVEVIQSSFRNYIEDSKRTDQEVAMLLAREWQCLQSLAPLSPSLQATTVATRVAMPPLPSPAFADTKLPAVAAGMSGGGGTGGIYHSDVLEGVHSGGNATLSKALSRPSFVFQPLATTKSGGGIGNAGANDGSDDGMISYDHSKTRSVSVCDQGGAAMP